MKKLLLIICASISLVARAQSNHGTELIDSIVVLVEEPIYDTASIQLDTKQEYALKEQANKLVHALIARDYESYALNVHPRVLQAVGGKEALISLVKKSSKTVGIRKVWIGEHTKVVRAGDELHTFLAQRLKILLPVSTIYSNSHLLAISKDNGMNWHFVDASSLTKEKLQKLFPNFNPALPIPPKQ